MSADDSDDPFAVPSLPFGAGGVREGKAAADPSDRSRPPVPPGGGAEAAPRDSGGARGPGKADPSAGQPQTSSGMAAGGKPVAVDHGPSQTPAFPDQVSPDAVYVPDESFDFNDLADVNREMNRARARLFRVSGELKTAQRMLVLSEVAYKRALRRQLVSISGGSADSRKAIAELACEEQESDYVVAAQIVEEWKKRSTDARDDLKAIENLSHNVRAQIDVR